MKLEIRDYSYNPYTASCFDLTTDEIRCPDWRQPWLQMGTKGEASKKDNVFENVPLTLKTRVKFDSNGFVFRDETEACLLFDSKSFHIHYVSKKAKDLLCSLKTSKTIKEIINETGSKVEEIFEFLENCYKRKVIVTA